jgi:hypothetical protein
MVIHFTSNVTIYSMQEIKIKIIITASTLQEWGACGGVVG